METLQVRGLKVSYKSDKQRPALVGVNLTVSKGEVFGFLGPNGAGKTTLIKSIMGLSPVVEGQISLWGQSILDKGIKAKIGFMPEQAFYYPYLSPRELLYMYGKICGVNKAELKQRVEILLGSVGLLPVKNKLIKTFSKGMLQKLNFIQSLINDPDFLVLDEPTSGLDPVLRIRMRDIIKSLKAKGKTIFFSSHELSEAELVCDRVGIIKDGRIIKTGNLKELLKHKKESHTLERYFLNIIEAGSYE